MYKLLRKLIPNEFIYKMKRKMGVPDQTSSFLRLKKLGFSPTNVLDIGAYEGKWALEFSKLFPEANILMIEGQEQKSNQLLEISKKIKNSSVKIALLGAEKKAIEFNIYETASSIFKEDNNPTTITETIELQLLDDIIANSTFKKCDFIKLDTQGAELEILKGGSLALSHAEVVLMEVSMLGIYKNAPLVDEVIQFMKSKNFVLYDICSIMRRPYDDALFQSDFLFVKENHFLRNSTRWQ